MGCRSVERPGGTVWENGRANFAWFTAEDVGRVKRGAVLPRFGASRRENCYGADSCGRRTTHRPPFTSPLKKNYSRGHLEAEQSLNEASECSHFKSSGVPPVKSTARSTSSKRHKKLSQNLNCRPCLHQSSG